MILDDIIIFTKVIEHNSFSKASHLLRIPKSTISRRISQMEERLRVKLLNRTTRRLSPTHIGQAYYEKCVVILEGFEEAESLIKGLQAEPKGRLRITVPYELGLLFLKEAVMDFIKTYPDINLELELTNRMVDLIDESYDLALRIGPLADSSLTAVKVLAMQGGIYASPSYWRARTLPQSPSNLLLTDCIQFRTSRLQAWKFFHPQEGMIEVQPAGRLQLNSMDYICESAVNGFGIAALNRIVASPYVREGKLVEVLQNYVLSFPDIFAVYPSRKYLSPNVRAFIEHIKPRLAQIDQPPIDNNLGL
jgi:DNA-binding transcriptional LysR family regulator